MFVNVLHRKKKGYSVRMPFTATSIAAVILFPNTLAFAEEVENSNIGISNYLESEDYIFTAERIPTNRWDTPANVHVITAQEIEDNHYQTIEEALSHINGIATYMVGMQSGGAIMNGNYRVLMLIDGRRANSSQTEYSPLSKSDFTAIPSMKMIERIEVVKGGYSALYGTDAVGGVINIITKKGALNETTLDFNAGSWNKQNYELTNQGQVGKFSWFVTGDIGKSHAYKYKGPGTDNLSNLSDYDDNGFSIRLDNRFTDRNSLTLSATHKTHKWDNKLISNLYNNVSLSYNFKEGTNTPSWLRYFNNYRTKVLVNHPANMRIQGVEYQNGWEFGRHKIIAGFEWHKNEANNKLEGYENKDVNNNAFYIQDTIKLGEKWNVIPGTRWDHSSEYGNNWSPKISANYRADDKTKIYASWGRVYRAPTIAEIYMVDTDTGYYGNNFVLSNGGVKKLRSEKGTTETIGIEHSFNQDTSIALNFFHSNISNAIYWKRALTPFFKSDGTFDKYDYTHFPTNEEKAKTRGLELSFNQKLNAHFSYNIGYSHTKLKNLIEASYFTQPNGYRAGIHYNNRGLRLNLLSIMASGRATDPSDWIGYPSAKYAVFDFNATYDINEYATVYFKANNFTNQNYTAASKEYHVPGKFFMAGATFRF